MATREQASSVLLDDDDYQIKEEEDAAAAEAHVLVFPFPAQGHINSMLRLAKLLSLHGGIRITFLNTHFNHSRLLHSKDAHFPSFHFTSIADGLSDDNPRSADNLGALHRSLAVVGRPQLLELLSSSKDGSNPITCVFTDGLMTFPVDVCGELGIPVVAVRTASACSFWIFYSIPHLFEAGELPFPEGVDLDGPVESVPGVAGLLRRRDLPLSFRSRDLDAHPTFNILLHRTRHTPFASAFIMNTFEFLEGPILSLIRSHVPRTYAVGPLHAFLKEHPSSSTSSTSSGMSLWEEDRECIAWLDTQPPKSVIYVSFGSFTTLSNVQLVEIWNGLVDSGQKFMWALRADSVNDARLVDVVTSDRSCVVKWAPQEEVLSHPSVGGFFTHSGWNSTLESIAAGVPMLCWPFFADQQVNSRYVSEVWKVGIDIKDTCDRNVVAKAVVELMEGKKAQQLRAAACALAQLVKDSVHEGGSSHSDFRRLVDDIKMMRLQPPSLRGEFFP